MPVRHTLLVVAVMLCAAGCASSEEASYSSARKTTVEVENQNFYDINLFIVRNSQRVRLGYVRSNDTRVLEIPNYIALSGGMVAFVADPIGGPRTPFSQEIFIQEGEQLRLVIPAI